MAHDEEAVSLDHRLKRLEKLEEQMGSVTTQLAEVKTTEAALVEGVSNFRRFQLDMRYKIGFVYGAAWLFGILNGIALVVLGVLLAQAAPFIKAAIAEYYHNHPDAEIHRQGSTAPLQQASRHVTLDATAPSTAP